MKIKVLPINKEEIKAKDDDLLGWAVLLGIAIGFVSGVAVILFINYLIMQGQVCLSSGYFLRLLEKAGYL
jgi:hypothetical protein